MEIGNCWQWGFKALKNNCKTKENNGRGEFSVHLCSFLRWENYDHDHTLMWLSKDKKADGLEGTEHK